jgi:predicted nucleic acid-binding protein
LLESFAFWDSSVLVPLCVIQEATPQAFRLRSTYRMVVWWATRVEIASALARMLRRQEITSSDHRHALQQLLGLTNLWDTVTPSSKIAQNACALVELYPLRAADALQLASALEWCEGKPKGRVFLSFNQRLREAAEMAGFTLQ